MATENALMRCAHAGTTMIGNAACEPHVQISPACS